MIKSRLILHPTIPTFNDYGKNLSENLVRKAENGGNQHFLLFPHFFFYQRKKLHHLGAILNLIARNVFNLEQSKLLSPDNIAIPFPNKPWFLRVCNISLLKTLWEKEKLLVTSNFSFSHSVFYSFGELTAIVITFEIVVCKLFEFGRV